MNEENSSNISISMIIDKKNKSVIKPIKSILELSERTINHWVDDKSVISCYNCQESFSFINRKHHCRNCGKVFCKTCSDFWIEIPNHIKTVPKNINILNLSTYIDYFNFNQNNERTCLKCFIKITEIKELYKTNLIFEKLPLNVRDYNSVACVCKSWYKIAYYYFSFFREIQYKLPSHKFNKQEINFLYINRHILTGHSKYLTRLIICTDWENISSIKKKNLLNIIFSNKKSCSCWKLICTRNCNESLEPEDIIICMDKVYPNEELYQNFINILYNLEDSELKCYITFLIYKLRLLKNYPKILKMFTEFLFRRCISNKILSNLLFWELTFSSKDVEFQKFYSNIRKNLVNKLDNNTRILFLNGYDFTQNITEIVEASNNIREDLLKHLRENDYFENGNFRLPINFNKKFVKINTNKIKIFNSKTKPIIFPCTYYDNNQEKEYNIMIKNEDIRKEYIIMNIINLMDNFIKKDLGLDLFITKYNILPISNNYGYIEFVQNAHTLYDLKEQQLFSIQNFIMEKNPELSTSELRENFTKSCAAYCVITYLLGIGDRHLENIMITDNAHIFNIDFGYVLGKDPKIIAPEFRLTPEMIDAMGGPKSKYYNDFKKYCIQAYNCLRRHTSIFYIQLLLLIKLRPKIMDEQFTENYLNNYINKRFVPGENYDEAGIQFTYKINKNSNTYSGNIIDYFHKKYKSSVTNSSETLYEAGVTALHATTTFGKKIGSNIKSLFWNST
jgi:hypothetical protein